MCAHSCMRVHLYEGSVFGVSRQGSGVRGMLLTNHQASPQAHLSQLTQSIKHLCSGKCARSFTPALVGVKAHSPSAHFQECVLFLGGRGGFLNFPTQKFLFIAQLLYMKETETSGKEMRYSISWRWYYVKNNDDKIIFCYCILTKYLSAFFRTFVQQKYHKWCKYSVFVWAKVSHQLLFLLTNKPEFL